MRSIWSFKEAAGLVYARGSEMIGGSWDTMGWRNWRFLQMPKTDTWKLLKQPFLMDVW